MRHTLFSLLVLLTAMLLWAPVAAAAPLGTAFTYQGEFKQGGVRVTGDADFVFRLWDAETGGTEIDSQGLSFVEVVDGLFTVQLDFGTKPFDGTALWLEISAEFPSGEGNWVTLTPRQSLTAVPYALYSLAGSDSLWTQTGTDIYYSNGNVGIGASSPVNPLHVTSAGSRTANIRNTRATGGTALSVSAGAQTGYTYALDAYVASPTGYGVYAFNEAESGNAYAILGESNSPDGVAIYGMATNDNERSTGIGVYGRSNSDYGGTGVYGEATNSGTTYGVRGVATYGTGVRGENQDTGNHGALGTSSAAVYGYTNSASGYASYFEGGQNYFEGSLGIGAQNPVAPLHVTSTGNWHWTLGNGWGDFTLNNGEDGLSMGVHPDYAIVYMWTHGDNPRLRIGNPTDGVIMAIENDSVGIGTISPSETLDVMGTARIRGTLDADSLKVHGPTAANWVLTSDADGVASWQPPGSGAWYTAGSDIYYDGGFVGIGTNSPEYMLDVGGKACMDTTVDDTGYIAVIGENGEDNARLTYLDGYPNNGFVAVKDPTGMTRAGVYVDEANEGIVYGDTKSFRVSNPMKSGTEIWYTCPEGPEAAAYVRGTGSLVNGTATIPLPDHFTAVAGPEGMTVQVTALSDQSKGLAVVEKNAESFVVKELLSGTGNYSFDYLVMAVRKGYTDYRVIRPDTQGKAAPHSRSADGVKGSTPSSTHLKTSSPRSSVEAFESKDKEIETLRARLGALETLVAQLTEGRNGD